MTVQVNPALSEIESIFKNVVWDPLFAAGETWLIAEVPALKLPILSTLEHATIQEISDYTFGLVKEFIDIEYIVLKDNHAQKIYTGAVVSLKALALQKGIDSDDFKKARDQARDDFAQFILYRR